MWKRGLGGQQVVVGMEFVEEVMVVEVRELVLVVVEVGGRGLEVLVEGGGGGGHHVLTHPRSATSWEFIYQVSPGPSENKPQTRPTWGLPGGQANLQQLAKESTLSWN